MIPDKMVEDAYHAYWFSDVDGGMPAMSAALETAGVGELIDALKPFAVISALLYSEFPEVHFDGAFSRARAVLEKLGVKL